MNSKIIYFKIESRNPYFIGINSAIVPRDKEYLGYTSRNPYFIGINSAIVQNFDYFQCFDI